MAENAGNYLSDFKRFNGTPAKLAPLAKPAWRPPTTGLVKANFDGAFFEDLGEAGIGVVIRNSLGEVMASLSEKIPKPLSIITLKPWQLGVQFCLQKSMVSTSPH